MRRRAVPARGPLFFVAFPRFEIVELPRAFAFIPLFGLFPIDAAVVEIVPFHALFGLLDARDVLHRAADDRALAHRNVLGGQQVEGVRVHQDMPWGLFRQAVARTFDRRQYEVHLVAVGGRLCRVAPLCVGEREKVEHLRRERIGFQRLRTGLDDGQQVGVGGCVDVQSCERFVETVECGVRLQRAVLRLVGVAVVEVVVVFGREGRVGLLVAQPEACSWWCCVDYN